MDEIIKGLLKLENEFNSLKERTERFHIIFIIIYFLPPVTSVIILNKYFKEHFNLFIKILLYAVILIGVIIHYFFRHKYFKSKNRYKDFITSKLNEIKVKYNNDSDFKNAIVKAVKQIAEERSILLTNETIKNSQIWNLIFLNIGIEFDENNLIY